jgi:HemY protein
MLRALKFFVALGLLVAVSVWFAENPGTATVLWGGYRVDAPVALVAAAAAVLLVALAFLYRLLRALRRAPGEFRARRGETRRRKGYAALSEGMVAVAAGDAARARRLAKRADVLLGDPPLTLLLSAQAAQLGGDDAAAERSFQAMLERPETEFLGLRGLLSQAMRKGAWDEALNRAERASGIHPEAPWAATALFDLLVRSGRWAQALATLDRLKKHQHWGSAEERRRRAVLTYLRALEVEELGDAGAGLRLLRQAHDLAPDFVPAAARLARRILDAGRARKGADVIEASWVIAPHPDLLAIYETIEASEDALMRIKWIQRLTMRNPAHLESHIALARVHLKAQLWGVAREHLEAAAGTAPTARVFRLMAELDEREKGDAAGARRWLVKAAEADSDPTWVCDACGTAAAAWGPLCGNCQAFDALRWRSRPRGLSLLGHEAEPEALPGPGT